MRIKIPFSFFFSDIFRLFIKMLEHGLTLKTFNMVVKSPSAA